MLTALENYQTVASPSGANASGKNLTRGSQLLVKQTIDDNKNPTRRECRLHEDV